MMPARDVRYYMLVGTGMVQVPRSGLDWSLARSYSRNSRNEKPPGSPRAFVLGDGEWNPFVLTLSFNVRGDGASAGERAGDAESDVNLVITRANQCTSVIREEDTTPLTDGSGSIITDGNGDPIYQSVGHAIAVNTLLTPSITPIGPAGELRVTLGWLTRFGLPTTTIAETQTEYDSATTTF